MSLVFRPNASAIARMLSPTGSRKSIFPRTTGPTAILRMYIWGRLGKLPPSPTAIIAIAP
jgi:hypothetical protein